MEVRDQPCGSSARCCPHLSLQGSKLFSLQVGPSQRHCCSHLQRCSPSTVACCHISLCSNCSWVGKHNTVASAGSTPVPATSKADIDAALQKLTDRKQQWVMQPCARRAELLRACIQQALLVRSHMFGRALKRQCYASVSLQWTSSESTTTEELCSYRLKMKLWMRL